LEKVSSQGLAPTLSFSSLTPFLRSANYVQEVVGRPFLINKHAREKKKKYFYQYG
jgi:hypothetical protein